MQWSFAMVKHLLAMSDEVCLQIARQRLQDPFCHATTCDALHEIEEAVQVLDREDEQMVQNAKEDDFKRRERKQVSMMATGPRLRSLLLRVVGNEL